MTDDNCSDCGLALGLHFREDGIYGCPRDMSTTCSLKEGCSEPMDLDVQNVSSPDPLDFLSILNNKQRSQRHNPATRCPTQLGDVTIPLRRSARRRAREVGEPYSQTQGRRPSLGTAGMSMRHTLPRRISLQDSRRSRCGSYENESLLPTQKLPYQRFRRQSLQPHVLNRMVPVEDMDPIEGFQPFTELEYRQQHEPVTIPEPVRDVQKARFEYVWNPSVVVSKVGGMRVRVGEFRRIGRPVEDTMTAPSSPVGDGNESNFWSSGSEGYFTAQCWSSSSFSTRDPRPSNHGAPVLGIDLSPPHAGSHLSQPYLSGLQPEFIQGSSKSALPCGPRDTYPPFAEHELPQFEALVQHYDATQNKGNRVAPSQRTLLFRHAAEPTPSAFTSPSPMVLQQPEGPETPHLRQASCEVSPLQDPSPPMQPQIEQPHTLTRPLHRPIMPCTLPGTRITDYRSDSSPSLSNRVTGLAVDPSVDWATREPWEYIHHVLTSSTYPLVVFLKTPTEDIPAAALGARRAELHPQTVVINNERWLLVGPQDFELDRFHAGFQARAQMPDRFTVRFGDLTWGADVSQIEDEVVKAVIERARRGRDVAATLPAMFIAGTMGGLAVWYALSLM
jgi:hypothetical protein